MQDTGFTIQDKKNHASCIMHRVSCIMHRVSCIMHRASFLFVITCCLLLFSCTTKRVEMPDYEGVNVRDVITKLNDIESVEATFSVEIERNDSTITGDAALELTDHTLALRIYSLGFLVAEVTEADGVIKSNPELSRNRGIILVDGLRNSILWWRIKNYEVEDQDEVYHLKNSWKRILIDKKTMLPVSQTIELEDGKELRIFYEEPMYNGELWHPSRMRIELLRYLVSLEIKTILFKTTILR
ncbi:MAG: hypothetical protein HY754_03945 [Nitrospirae bacterium]|nr:hypothetical protein [Nitrospirota bacterium]